MSGAILEGWGRVKAQGAFIGLGALGDATLEDAVAGGAGGIFDGEDDGGAEVFFLFFFLLIFRRRFFGGFGVVGFVKLLEEAKFALEGAFGGGFVAQGEIILLDLIRHPVDA
jgi:hypothetical protein